jgi:cobalt-zinc-cadmium efflux system outer membrane protein
MESEGEHAFRNCTDYDRRGLQSALQLLVTLGILESRDLWAQGELMIRARGAHRQVSVTPVAQALGAGGRTLTILLIGVAGCAVRDYVPPLPPTFMNEDTPAGVIPSVRRTNASRASDSSPAARSTPPQPATPAPSEKLQGSEKTQTVEELPPPALERSAGITLEQAILETLQADPKLRAGLELINQANADLLTSSLPPNPTFTPDGVLLPLRRFTIEKQGGPPQIDFLLAYPIDWFLFGKRTAAIASARLGVDVSAADYADLVRQRVAATIAVFYDVLEALALLDLAQQDRDSLKRVEGITAERVKLGGVGTIEQDRIRLSVLDSEREVRNRQTALTSARAKLRAALGRGNAEPAFEVSGSLEVPASATLIDVEEALALAEETRPDIISLRRQISKADATVTVERTKAYPSVTPSAALTRQFQSSIGFPDAPSFDVYLAVTIPFFDRNQGNIAKAESALVQSGFNLQTQLVQLRADIEQAVNTFRAAQINVTANDPKQLEAARNVRDKTEAAYKVGGKTLLEVLDAQRSYRDTYRTYIMGRSTYWHSLHQLNATVGKQVLR